MIEIETLHREGAPSIEKGQSFLTVGVGGGFSVEVTIALAVDESRNFPGREDCQIEGRVLSEA